MMSQTAEENAKQQANPEDAQPETETGADSEARPEDGQPQDENATAQADGQASDPAGDDRDEDAGDTLLAERDSLKDQLLRMIAENENLRKRSDKEIARPRNMVRSGWRVICWQVLIIWKRQSS